MPRLSSFLQSDFVGPVDPRQPVFKPQKFEEEGPASANIASSPRTAVSTPSAAPFSLKPLANFLKEAPAKAISNVIYQTPLSGRMREETGLTLDDYKTALKSGPIGSFGFEMSLQNQDILKHPSQYVDVLSTEAKVAKTTTKPGIDAISKQAKNSLENVFAPKPGAYVRALDEVKQGIKPPIKVRTLEDGRLFIEDGRHHLEAARRLGVKDYPIEDVTSKYKVKTEPIRGEGGRFAGSRRLEDNPEAGFAKLPTGEELKETSQNIRTQLVDRLAPLHDLTKGKVSAAKDPYVQARLYAGHFGKVQNRLDELSAILTPTKKDLPTVTEYAVLERFDELANRGFTKFPGGESIESIRARKAALETKLGPEKLQAIQDAGQQLRGYSDRLLQETRDAGIISEAAYNAIKAKNEKYIPLQRLAYLAEQVDNIPRGSQSFSVSSQNLIKSIQGSEKEIADPIESMIRNTYKTVSLIERNKVAQKVADLASIPAFKNTVIPLQKGTEVPLGMEKLSVFRNGIKEEYAVPKHVGEALKGMNQETTDLITKAASLASRGLRAGATSLNVAFIPTNAIRDFQTAMVTSKVGFTPLDWLKGFASAVSKDADYKAFLESGGSFSGYFEQGKSLAKTAKKLTEGKTLKAAKTITNPFSLLRQVGEVIELSPRIGVYKRSVRKGLSQTEAAFNAREATVDFAKSGSAMKVLNQWSPFLNARLQGATNLFKAVKRNPIRSALVIGTIVEAPTIATYLHNTRNHEDIWNDIAQYEKDSNYIIIYGDERDEKGNPTQVFKIPKGDLGRVFSNPTENFLSFLDNRDRKSVDQLATQMLSDISPVGFERDGEVSGRAALSSILPPTAKVGVESVTNENLYTGREIVPKDLQQASPREQYTNDTSRVARFVGDKLNVSPLKLENAVSSQFGGLGRQILNPGRVGSDVSSRFSGARGGAEDQRMRKEAEKYLTEQADKQAKLKREAQKKLESLQNSPDAAEDFKAIKKRDPELAAKIADLKEKKDLGYTSKDYVIADLGVENGQRAKFIYEQLNKLNSKEEKAALWDELKTKKLITTSVDKQIRYLLKNE